MGIAVIIPNVDFSDANLGQVTLQGNIPLQSLTIVGSDAINSPEIYTVNYTPATTTNRDVTWSVVSGGTYASIDSDTGELTPIAGANLDTVVIRATSVGDNTIYAEKAVMVTADSGIVYIEKSALVGDGLARINTGYIFKSNSALYIDYTVDALPTATGTAQYRNLWGAYESESEPTTRHLLIIQTGGSTKQSIQFGANKVSPQARGHLTELTTLPTIGQRYKQTADASGLVSDPTLAYSNDYNYGGFTQPNAALLIMASLNTAPVATEMTLYSVKISESGVDVMNLVPCTLAVDIPAASAWDNQAHLAGENGLWDKVGDKFYGNSYSSGSFSVIAQIPLTSLQISGPDAITEPETFSVNYTPINTSQRGITWSVVSGGTYASIDSDTGELTPLIGASMNNVVIRATSIENNTIYAEKTVSVSFGMVYEPKLALVGDGLARINSGYQLTSSTKFVIEYQIVSLPTATGTAQYRSTWGAYSNASSPLCRHLLTIVNNASIVKQLVQWGADKSAQTTGRSYETLTNISTGVKIKDEISMADGFLMDGSISGWTPNSYTGFTQPIDDFLLFSASASSTTATEMKCFSAKFYEGGVLARDLVPCTLVSDVGSGDSADGNPHYTGENGMWDKVGKKFYGNAYSSGSFTVNDF